MRVDSSPYLDAGPAIGCKGATLPLRRIPSVDAAFNLYRGTVGDHGNGTILSPIVLEFSAFHGDEARVLSVEHSAVLRTFVIGECPARNADVPFRPKYTTVLGTRAARGADKGRTCVVEARRCMASIEGPALFEDSDSGN